MQYMKNIYNVESHTAIEHKNQFYNPLSTDWIRVLKKEIKG